MLLGGPSIRSWRAFRMAQKKDLSDDATLHDILMRGEVYHIHAKRISDAYTKGSSARVKNH